MIIIKRILIVIGILIALPLLVALFVKNNYTVEREVLINKPENVVFDYVKYLKNLDNYSKWAGLDPEMKKTYSGTDGTIGFVSAWDSEDKNVGEGEQEITGIIEGERIDFEIRFIEPFPSVAPAYIITEPVSESETMVKWGFKGYMNYPMNIIILFMDLEKAIGDDLQTGLNNLKVLLEK